MSGLGVEGVVLGPLGPLSLAVPAGEALGVVGVNGAGKSLLMAALAGVVRPARGVVSGVSGAAYLPEGCPLDGGIPVRSWLRLAASLPGWESGFGAELVAAFALPERRPVAALSQGQRVRLGLVLTLGRRAPVYLLDDPFLGLDPVARRSAEGFIARRCEAATVVVAGQDSGAIERLCTWLALLDRGQLRAFGPLESWRQRYRALRVRGAPDAAIAALGGSVLRADGQVLLLDDPDGGVEGLLVAAGASIERQPLALDALLAALVAA